MVDELRSDDEQEEALKRWLADYGKSVATGILLAVAILFGWQGYQQKQQADAEAASALFQNLLLAAEQDSEAGRLSVGSFSEQLKSDYPGSFYAQMAALHVARIAVKQGALDDAAAELQWVLDRSPPENLEPLVQLRLGRVYLAQQNYDELMKLVDLSTEPYSGAFLELKADALVEQGKKGEAIEAYQTALALNEKVEQLQGKRNIEMKLQSLGVNVES